MYKTCPLTILLYASQTVTLHPFGLYEARLLVVEFDKTNSIYSCMDALHYSHAKDLFYMIIWKPIQSTI